MGSAALRCVAPAHGSFAATASVRRHSSIAPRQSRGLGEQRWKRCRSFELLEHRHLLTAISDWQIRGVGGGGALFSPSINPQKPSEMYIASDMGQIFHSTNDGQLWDTVDFRKTHGGHSSQVQFTSNPLGIAHPTITGRACRSVELDGIATIRGGNS